MTSFDAPKTWHGRTYTGMKVGRGHHWDYEGKWVERKLGPDLWEVDFVATKTRKGKGAPEGSGAPVGTEYHWFLAPVAQSARKLDANTYETRMQGFKWKIGFRPATSATGDYPWARTGETARQRASRLLEQTLGDLKAEEKAGEPDLAAPELEGVRPTPPPRPKRKAVAAKKRAKPKAEGHAAARKSSKATG